MSETIINIDITSLMSVSQLQLLRRIEKCYGHHLALLNPDRTSDPVGIPLCTEHLAELVPGWDKPTYKGLLIYKQPVAECIPEHCWCCREVSAMFQHLRVE